MKAPILRRTRGDLIATGVIAAVCVLALLIAFFSAPIRQDTLTPAAEEMEDGGKLAIVPESLTETFSLIDDSPQPQPVTTHGLAISYADGTVTATTPGGDTTWTYERGAELCGLSQGWGKVIAVYRTKIGCGDAVAIDAATGQYSRTRSAIAPEEIGMVSSNDRVGIVGSERIELWRNDLVRTVEYGEVEAPQEPDMQPNPGCTITSALTRTELLALTETCADGTWLRFQTASPEDSRKPEMHESVSIAEGSYLVAAGEEAAAVYDPASSTVTSYSQDSNKLADSKVPEANLLAEAPNGFMVPQVADLPHHMSFFDGKNLLLLDPSTLAVTTIYEGALGTGFAAGERLLFPVQGGIAVANWEEEGIDKVIPVDRGGYTGPVSIDSAGATVVEKRGNNLAVLSI